MAAVGAALLLWGLLLAYAASPARAEATITVNSLADSTTANDGKCTLREAITSANNDPTAVPAAGECANGSGSDVINIEVPGTVNLTGPLPDLSSNIEIGGPGADQFTVRRETGGDYRIFTVTSGSVVSISGITISNGIAPGTLPDGKGGGIRNEGGTLTVSDSTITGNSAYIGGGVYSNTDLSGIKTTITNSTISGNSAFIGGGVHNEDGLTVIEHSTITHNTARDRQGSGVASVGDTVTRTEVLSTIISANTNTDVDSLSDNTNSFDSKGYNLIGDGNATIAFDTTKDDQVGVSDPKLGAFSNNGGPTKTHALLAGSPAIDKGKTTLATDQRGEPRPFDDPSIAPATGGDDSDIGSFEAQEVLNSAPQANGDSYTVSEDGTLTEPAPGVLSNDTDADPADTLEAVLVSGPTNGTLTLDENGSFTYEPDDNYNGEDSFTYKANDGTLQSNEATVTITVNAVNDAPVATDDTRTMKEDGAPITIDLASLVSDVETSNANLTYNIVSGPTPAQGTLSGTGSTRTFDSADNFNGSVEIVYTVTDRGDPDDCGTPDDDCDAPETSDQGTVTINVTPVNDAPTMTVSGGSCLSDTSASGRLNLTVGDVDKDDPPSSLSVSATSRQQDQGLIPDANLVAGGSGADRTLTLNALPRKSGTAIITVSVYDGTATTTLPVTLKVGTQSSETITGTSGTDVIFGLGGSGVLEGDGGPDLICGGNGNDTMRGGGGNDVLDGGRGDDRLDGGTGADRLLGKAGTDTLTGGADADFFSGGSGTDTATDFTQGDTKDATIP